MNIKFIPILILSIMVAACAAPPPRYTPDNAGNSLAEASYSVSRSLSSLSETAQASHPPPRLDPGPSPSAYGMSGLTTIDWSGPVEPLVCQIAKVANYQVRILGTAPAIPILVTLYDKNRMIADVLRDVGYQCGRRAVIVVYPESRIIELRYAKN